MTAQFDRIAEIAFKEILRQFLTIEARGAETPHDIIPDDESRIDKTGQKIAHAALLYAESFETAKAKNYGKNENRADDMVDFIEDINQTLKVIASRIQTTV